MHLKDNQCKYRDSFLQRDKTDLSFANSMKYKTKTLHFSKDTLVALLDLLCFLGFKITLLLSKLYLKS